MIELVTLYYLCEASNLAGRKFYARGLNKKETQIQAVLECEKVSSRCFARGCEVVYEENDIKEEN